MTPSLPPRALAALHAVARRLDAAGVRWVLAGSAGRALLGHRVRPADLDVEVAGEDARRAGAALGTTLRRASGRGRSSLRAGAAVGDVAIDVTADLVVEGPGGRLAPDLDAQSGAGLVARSGGLAIPLAPAEEALARAIVLGDWDALGRIAAQAAAGGAAPPDAAYLARRLSSARPTASS